MITDKDLDKINGFIEMYNRLPKDGNLRIGAIFGELNEIEKKELLNELNHSDDLFRNLFAFIKVKFGKEHDYFKDCMEISFDPEVMGLKIHTTDRNHYRRSFQNGMRDLENLLKSMKAEINELIEDSEEKIKLSKNNMKNDIKHISNSNVIIGDVNHSNLSKTENKEDKSNDVTARNENLGATKKWQKITVFISISIFILTGLYWFLSKKRII